jgi:nucleoside-diphosphate-sugar epimerase
MSRFAGAAVLVTGGAGFVGSNLTKRLLADGAKRVHVIDNLLSSERENLPGDARVELTAESITNDAVLAALRDEYDYVFHLSTYHGNQSSISNPLADHENNTLTTLKLYERLKTFSRTKKIVYSAAGCSSAEKTFDKPDATVESDVVSLHMDSPYSISKAIGEFYSVYYHKQHRLPAVRARFQNVFGPGEVLGAGEWRGTPATVWRNVTPTFIYRALHGEAPPLENEGAGTRDFIYVDDIVEGLIACALRGDPGEAYNLASGSEVSIKEWAGIINELTGNRGGVTLLPRRSWDNSGRRYGSTEKAKRELGFVASIDKRQGLEETIAWMRERMPFIESCIAKHRSRLPS